MLEVTHIITCECGQHALTFLAIPAGPAIQTPHPSPIGLQEFYEQGLTDAGLIALHKSPGYGALGGAS